MSHSVLMHIGGTTREQYFLKGSSDMYTISNDLKCWWNKCGRKSQIYNSINQLFFTVFLIWGLPYLGR